jgi:error-prone DNA polymerase
VADAIVDGWIAAFRSINLMSAISTKALADECSLAGIVRAHGEAKKCGLKPLVGSQFQVDPVVTANAHTPGEADGDAPFVLTVLACNLQGYGNLSEFITGLRRSAPKGTYALRVDGISGAALTDCVVIASPKRMSSPDQLARLGAWLLKHFPGCCWIGAEMLRLLDDEMWLHRLRSMSELTAIPLVAVGDVHYHVRSRKPLQEVMTATRLRKPLTDCRLDLHANTERHLRTRLRLAQTYPADLVAETLRVAARCTFSLDELKYEYPHEVVPEGETGASYLRRITYEGAARRWPEGVPAKVQDQIERELELVAELQYESYFRTVADIVAFARSRGILCQGRGSAANSVICYCTGVTEVDPGVLRAGD